MRMFRFEAIALAAILSAAWANGTAAQAQRDRPLGARQLSFAAIGAESGLTSPSVFDLEFDRDGDLWIATQEGLSRFDGERFRAYATDEGLPSGVVFDVEQDASGALWAATLRGLAWSHGDRFTPVSLPGAPPGEAIEALALDAEGRLIAGAVGGAYRCELGGCERIFETDADKFVSAIALDRASGELWFGGPFGLVRWRDREIERYDRGRGLPALSTRALLVDRRGTLWIRQILDVVRLDTNDGRVEVIRGLPPAHDTSRWFEDADGALWVTSDAGLYRRDGDAWQRIGGGEGLPDGATTALAEDGEGALWIGFAHAGLARWLGRGRFVGWTSTAGLPSDTVWAIARDGAGRLAFGTQTGLALVDTAAETVRTFPGHPLLGASPVLSLAAATGGLWVGTATGGVAFVADSGRVLDAARASALADDTAITAILPRADGAVWLASSTGLWRGSGPPERIRFEPVPGPSNGGAAAPPELFFDLAEDANGTLWAAGRHGLGRFADGAWTRLTRADGLRDDFLLSVDVDRDGTVWVAYRDQQGISAIDVAAHPPRLRHFDRRHGLPHDQATLVRADLLGRIWVGTTHGLAVRDGDRFLRFSASDGLPSGDFCSNAFFADRDGTTWLGTPHGAVAARLSAADLTPRAPLAARIQAASLSGLPVRNETLTRAPHDASTFEATFAARSFRAPSEIEFRYQLSDTDHEPVVTRQRTVRYPALPPGGHAGGGAARRDGGSWGPEAHVRFEILPPWWATLPARLAALGIALLIGLLIDRLRAGRDRRHAVELERAVAARTEELRASREELARKNEELAHLSLTDPLTGLKNRRFAWDYVAEEVARLDAARRREGVGDVPERLVFFLMDVDLFKSINDLYGHEVGDDILVEAAERVRAATRISDVAVRWGGEEFLVIARDLPRAEWGPFAARLRAALGSPPFVPSAEVGPVRCTASLGYAAYPFDGASTLPWQQVLRLADLALYAVKQCGRDADLGVEPGRNWNGAAPTDLLAAQAGGVVHLRWGNVARPAR